MKLSFSCVFFFHSKVFFSRSLHGGKPSYKDTPDPLLSQEYSALWWCRCRESHIRCPLVGHFRFVLQQIPSGPSFGMTGIVIAGFLVF